MSYEHVARTFYDFAIRLGQFADSVFRVLSTPHSDLGVSLFDFALAIFIGSAIISALKGVIGG